MTNNTYATAFKLLTLGSRRMVVSRAKLLEFLQEGVRNDH